MAYQARLSLVVLGLLAATAASCAPPAERSPTFLIEADVPASAEDALSQAMRDFAREQRLDFSAGRPGHTVYWMCGGRGCVIGADPFEPHRYRFYIYRRAGSRWNDVAVASEMAEALRSKLVSVPGASTTGPTPALAVDLPTIERELRRPANAGPGLEAPAKPPARSPPP